MVDRGGRAGAGLRKGGTCRPDRRPSTSMFAPAGDTMFRRSATVGGEEARMEEVGGTRRAAGSDGSEGV